VLLTVLLYHTAVISEAIYLAVGTPSDNNLVGEDTSQLYSEEIFLSYLLFNIQYYISQN